MARKPSSKPSGKGRKAAPTPFSGTLPFQASVIETWPIVTLTPHARNARTHDVTQIDQLVTSMREFGWTLPVLADRSGEIIAGHGRVLAAEKLGLTEVPVIIAPDDWDDAKRRAYMLADNKIALNAGWDQALLGAELAELLELGSDIPAVTGFSELEISALTAAVVSGGKPVEDPAGEWVGMPEFDQQDKTAHRSIVVHMKDEAAVEKFRALVEAHFIGQPVTEKTRFLWFPEIEIETYADKRYAAGSAE